MVARLLPSTSLLEKTLQSSCSIAGLLIRCDLLGIVFTAYHTNSHHENDYIRCQQASYMKLVLIHGAGNSSLSFYYQLRHFRNSKAIDLPGHPIGRPCDTVDGYVEWVRGFISARRYKDVVLLGHSMGGAIAMQYALRYPEELKGLILLGTGARLRVKPEYLSRSGDSEAETESWLERQRSYYKGVEPDIIDALMRRAREVGPDVELTDLTACDRFDMMQEVEGVRLPTEIICGADDQMTPVKYADYLADKVKGSEKHIIPGGEHFVQLQQYRQVNHVIETFLKRQDRG